MADAGAAGGVDGGELDAHAVVVDVAGVADEKEDVGAAEGGLEVRGAGLIGRGTEAHAVLGEGRGGFGGVARDECDVFVEGRWD